MAQGVRPCDRGAIQEITLGLIMKKLTVLVLCLGLGAGIIGLWRLHQRTEALQTQAEQLRRTAREPVPEGERENIRRLTTLLAQVRKGDPAAGEGLRAELAAARHEATELEAAAQRAFLAATHAAPARENRDPERAFARLEYFQNVGRATPVDVVQTAVWAALKGDEVALRSCVSLSDEARTVAAAWLAELPETARTKYADPENFTVLAVTSEVLKSAAVQIKDFTEVGTGRGFVTFYRIESGHQPQKIPVARGADGWRISLPPQVLEGLRRQVKNTSVK